MRNLFLAGALTLLATTSYAHGPWSALCCSDRDCDFVDAKFIREDGDVVHVDLPPGAHPMWPADGRGNFTAKIMRSALQKPVASEWGVCIGPSGNLLCVYPPASGM